jgi:ribosomal protein S18 acetylase RimI-like enzyme
MKATMERLDRDNLPYAVGLAKELHGLGTFGTDGPPFEWDHCRSMMLQGLNNSDHYFMLARDSTGYVGAVVGHVEQHFFNPAIMGLMCGFVDWCINQKHALSVQSGDIANINSIGVDALYRRMGFARLGVIYKFVRKA